MQKRIDYFKGYPNVETFHFTSDGQAFFEIHEAGIHASSLDDKTVVTQTRAECEAEEKTEKETLAKEKADADKAKADKAKADADKAKADADKAKADKAKADAKAKTDDAKTNTSEGDQTTTK